ncbi:MAG: TetR/AcrR family transcriptional regulator [Myxococcales bacterium]|nr:TetR/AcrR family transcriptional regulator [Myxococcales bacterium]
MRYDADHKQRSRGRILEAARRLFRRDGFDGASIDQVMKAAGLTRGAFYAHFSSKEDLVAHVLDIEAGLVKALHDAAAGPRPRTDALAALQHYLATSERRDVATGCPLVAHPVDAVRGGDERRAGYGRRLQSLVDGVRASLDGPSANDDALMVSILAVAGGLLRAAVPDGELADRVEAACRSEIESRMSEGTDHAD